MTRKPTPYQIAILIVALVTLYYIYGTYTRMSDCRAALEAIDDLNVCRTCDMLERIGVIK